MNLLRNLGAALLVMVVLAITPAAALATTGHQANQPHGAIGVLILIGFGLAGTVSFTYSSFLADNPSPQAGTPYTGGTTAPSALQAAQVNRVNALISFTDTDTTINFTHNLAVSAAAALANEPDLIVYDFALGNSNTTPSGITWSVSNTNIAVGTKASTVGSGRTICITARRPASPGN